MGHIIPKFSTTVFRPQAWTSSNRVTRFAEAPYDYRISGVNMSKQLEIQSLLESKDYEVSEQANRA
jgi:hypothetical protein